MAVNTIDYAGPQPTSSAAMTADSKRGPTEYLWAPVPTSPNAWIADFIQDPSLGMHFYDDFLVTGSGPGGATSFQGSFGNWTLFQGADGGNIVGSNAIGGIIQFVPSSVASSSQTSGVSTPANTLQGLSGAFQLITNSSGASALQGKLVFECRVALTSIVGAKRTAFVGLSDGAPGSGNPFLYVQGGSSNELFSSASGTDNNLIGFYNPSYSATSSTPDWNFVFKLANTAPVFCSNLQNLVSTVLGSTIGAGTFYKLGFVYDPNAAQLPITTASNGQTVGNIAKAMIKVYVNGIQAAAFQTQTQNILTASFPTGIMAPIASFMYVASLSGTSNSATSAGGLMNLDWMRIAQNAIT
jgi:hypothetical protein